MHNSRRLYIAALLFGLGLFGAVLWAGSPAALANHTPNPTAVAVPGSFNSEIGCPGDWQPECENAQLAYDANDDVWQKVITITAGAPITYEYKAALNRGWDENYGLGGVQGGPNIPLPLTQTTAVKFYYDHKTHWVTDNRNSVIAVAPGSFQSELGCAGDWDPSCLRSWLQDPDGDGIYSFKTSALPAGNYEGKVALNESWDENYGAGCAPGGSNIAFNVPTDNAEIEFRYNAETHCLTIAGAQRGNLVLAEAHWVSRDTIAWRVPCAADNQYSLHWSMTATLTLTPTGIAGGNSLPLTCNTGGLGANMLQKFPHLSGFAALKLPNNTSLDTIRQILKGQVAVQASTAQGTLLDASGVQIPGVLDDVYAAAYDEPLGPLYNQMTPTLRLWAPTAQDVKLHLFADASTAVSVTVPMSYNATTGIWSASGNPGWNGMYYLYSVTVFTRASTPPNRIVTNLVTDPYSVSLAMNSTRSQIVNLADPSLKPAGWDAMAKPPLDAPEDIVVYELHMRDFSVNDPTVPAEHKGTYLAFTHQNSNGMKHLRALAQAGLTHIHLLPVFDIATIDENKSAWQSPSFEQLRAYPPTSTMQAQLIMAVADQDPFNWGYDPFHFNAPEGSYSTNPTGTTRIVEFRQMVQGLAQSGLRTVMDVVYNHTNSSGLAPRSVFDKIVPGYYHRLNLQGSVERSTCCENTAPEHLMFDKFVVESVVMWAKYYKIDGFRFDLMGHHPRVNLERVRDAVQSLTPANDGVDGSKIYIYGEGWNFGEVANNARFMQATQLEMAGTGIGTFNDRIRDGVRGGGPFSAKREQGFATGLYFDSNNANQCGNSPCTAAQELARLLQYQDWIRIGMAGNLRNYSMVDRLGNNVTGWQIDYNGAPAGYTLDPQENVNYSEAHDNETYFDAVAYKAPFTTTTKADRVRMQNLGIDVIALGQGVPFFHAGQDIMRSKSLDRDSYNSGDWFNRIDWTLMDNGFGSGLPPDTEGNEALMLEVLGRTAQIKPEQQHIVAAAMHFREILQVRKSSKLFRLETGQDVRDKVIYHNTGASQVPGLIVQEIDDTRGRQVDTYYARIVTLINAGDAPQTYTVASLAGTQLALHPILASSYDPVVRGASFNSSNGTFTVPARTTAVFVQRDACADRFTDVPPDHWAAGYIRWATCNGIVGGYADNTFRPDAETNRGQVAKMVVLAAGKRINTAGGPYFKDVPESDPFYDFIETARNNGMISGYNRPEDCGGVANTPCFKPYNLVTRAQLAKIIVEATGVPLVSPATATFGDVPVGHWAFTYVETAYQRQIIGGYDLPGGGREFRPGAPATRAQLSKMLFQAFAVPGQLDPPVDKPGQEGGER